MFNKNTDLISIKVTLTYLIFGSIWILLSDKLLSLIVRDIEMVTFLSLIKGFLYVTITAALIFYLVSKSLKQLRQTQCELNQTCKAYFDSNTKLQETNCQLEEYQAELEEQYQQTLYNQNRLQESEELYRLISEATNDAIWWEKNGVRYFSDRWFQITGYSSADIEASVDGWEGFVHPEDRSAAKEEMLNHLKNRTPFYSCEYRLKRKDGNYIWLYARGKASFDESGELCQMAGSHTDITDLKAFESKLLYLAYNDQLTGLKNRFSLQERLDQLISENCFGRYALLYIDIDNFKYVNDTMGHRFGDILLMKVSERLLNSSDSSTSVYRIGGDEFIILIENYERKEYVEKAAVRVLKAFKPLFEVENINIFTTISIGVSTYPEHGKDIDSLLKNADIALYKAKETGRNRIVFYNDPMNKELSERVRIEKSLRTALEKDEFELYYQPQLDIRTGAISGFEALIRWKSSELGFVPPNQFIGVAEATHMIIPIGEWVVKTACQFLNNLERLGYTGLSMSVNVSMLQLLQDDFVDMVMDSIDKLHLNPRQIELEITESILMESYEVIAGKLKVLRAKGVQIALDDFGKGYSSLNYLKLLPITTLKIDKSFIDTISSKGKTLTDLIVKMGRSMDLCVVAEGVETQEQLDFLVRHKCNKIQGYLFSKPMREADTISKLKEHCVFQNYIKEELNNEITG